VEQLRLLQQLNNGYLRKIRQLETLSNKNKIVIENFSCNPKSIGKQKSNALPELGTREKYKLLNSEKNLLLEFYQCLSEGTDIKFRDDGIFILDNQLGSYEVVKIIAKIIGMPPEKLIKLLE